MKIKFNPQKTFSPPLFVTLASGSHLPGAVQLFTAARLYGQWKGDFCLLTEASDESDLSWFYDNNIIVRRFKPFLNPDKWRQSNGSDRTTQLYLLKLHLFTEEFRSRSSIVYMDTDILIRGSINRLAKVKGFSAVTDAPLPRVHMMLRNQNELDSQPLDRIPRRSRAFNSGVFAFRPSDIPSDFVRTLEGILQVYLPYARFADQTFLNIALMGKWKKLPSEYNSLVALSACKTGPWLESIHRQARVIHFAGESDLSEPDCFGHEEWLENLRLAGYMRSPLGTSKARPRTVQPRGMVEFVYIIIHLKVFRRRIWKRFVWKIKRILPVQIYQFLRMIWNRMLGFS